MSVAHAPSCSTTGISSFASASSRSMSQGSRGERVAPVWSVSMSRAQSLMYLASSYTSLLRSAISFWISWMPILNSSR
eukprot:15808987-Heterocapsa_arctica.AAC.1